MSNILITLSTFLALISYVVYAVAILKGEAKPHRTTRFVLVLITGLATASLFAQESTTAIWLSSAFTLGCIVIFLLSLKYGMGGWAKADLLCLAIALAGIAFWQLTNNPVYGLFSAIGADLAGQIPMLIKTYRFPHTEVWTFYFLDVVAAVLSLLALSQWTFQEFSYPFYIIFIDGITIFLILLPRKTTLTQKS